MRIALIVPGGVDRSASVRVIPVLLALIERLARRHEVFVIAINQEPQACEYDLLGARVVNLGSGEGQSTNWGSRLVQLLSALKSFGGRLDILHAFWAHPPGSLAVAAGKLMHVPVMISIGGGELVWLPEIGYGGQGARRSRTIISAALRMATVVSAPSEYALLPLRKIRTDARWLPLGVDSKFFQNRAADGTGKERRILHVASLNQVKDQFTLMKATRQVYDALPDLRVDCIGVDTLDGRVQSCAHDLGISAVVRFHGVLAVNDLLPFYREAQLYVQSSLHESMGAAVLEASAAGVPVVGTSVGLVAEMAPKAAFAVPTKDVDALARAIRCLLTSEKTRAGIGQAAQKFARSYDADWSVSMLEGIYRQTSRHVISTDIHNSTQNGQPNISAANSESEKRFDENLTLR
jgi:glycosyltransferase involved in cell wall biosynthesis